MCRCNEMHKERSKQLGRRVKGRVTYIRHMVIWQVLGKTHIDQVNQVLCFWSDVSAGEGAPHYPI